MCPLAPYCGLWPGPDDEPGGGGAARAGRYPAVVDGDEEDEAGSGALEAFAEPAACVW